VDHERLHVQRNRWDMMLTSDAGGTDCSSETLHETLAGTSNPEHETPGRARVGKRCGLGTSRGLDQEESLRDILLELAMDS